MFGTSGADDLAVFFYLPVHTSDTPAPLNIFQAVVYETGHAHLDGKLANWVDDAG